MTENLPQKLFISGPFGVGKTTYAVETLYRWLDEGVPPERIIILAPQRTLARPYYLAVRDPQRGPPGHVDVRTVGGLARDMVALWWPQVAEEAGFADPDQEPAFLTIETAQYYMARFVRPAVERGEFDAVNVSMPRLIGQILDNLNKAALMGIDHRQVPDLLAAAWGDRSRARVLVYQAAGRVARAFRERCLQDGLLDYSLQIEVFSRLLQRDDFRRELFGRYTHLIFDNVEEDTPVAHDLVREWMPSLEAALLVYDDDGGVRTFLGADPVGGYALREMCDSHLEMAPSHVTTPALEALGAEIGLALGRDETAPPGERADVNRAFEIAGSDFYPQMIERVADEIVRLVRDEGIPPREIAVLAPFLSDALRFSLAYRLEERGILTVSHRPSRALRDEPAARCLLTLTALAHPAWKIRPPRADVADALSQAVVGLDPLRAQILTQVVYRPRADEWLTPFASIRPEMQARITYAAGERYDHLRAWLEHYTGGPPAPLDHFFSRLFGEVLSQLDFGFHTGHEAGRVVAELVESARNFRRTLFAGQPDEAEVGRQYLSIVDEGLLAALYVASWRDELADAVFMAPAYTFLMRNRAVEVQFWLDVGSPGWWERLDQPLTHPYVLSRNWTPGAVWADADEYESRQEMLYRLVVGLIRRCRRRVYLAISDLGEQGFEQRGPLLRIFQGVLRRYPREAAHE
jgi:hypothetical protein